MINVVYILQFYLCCPLCFLQKKPVSQMFAKFLLCPESSFEKVRAWSIWSPRRGVAEDTTPQDPNLIFSLSSWLGKPRKCGTQDLDILRSPSRCPAAVSAVNPSVLVSKTEFSIFRVATDWCFSQRLQSWLEDLTFFRHITNPIQGRPVTNQLLWPL